MERPVNRHLNIFDFFNGKDVQYIEDNLSRAFALCLKYDPVLLDNVLRTVLREDTYNDLFSMDDPNTMIAIDLIVLQPSLLWLVLVRKWMFRT